MGESTGQSCTSSTDDTEVELKRLYMTELKDRRDPSFLDPPHVSKMEAIGRVGIISPHQLPVDIVESLCSLLTGFDALSLLQTNSWWRNYLSDESFWQSRLQGSTAVENCQESWKKKYAQSRPMVFKALMMKDKSELLDACVYLTYQAEQRRRDVHRPSHFQLTHVGTESFSFDLWFSLLPASSEEYFGGIIYGLQSCSREGRQWSHYHQQFVMVSSTGDLYCSVLAGKYAVASDLQPNRWYHVALTYDHNYQRQEVFLDGEKVWSVLGTRHDEWSHLTRGQVGTGCVTSNTLNCPFRGHIGWYGFHGVVDAFRVWRGVLSQDDVKLLANGGELTTERLRAAAKPNSATTWQRKLQLNVQLAKCTRPAEGRTIQYEE
ncbi:hypothetical protein PF005_g4893 [Phytophthora fragariae]|uniref:F-box domain-containing protein n=2 Tax=Phytophthora fragariae TaxID=53985 RepID=A0A6A3YZ65_9STRA|nr:hypothetical protein PF005_g4893 [Phytophthora fragariae]KAE9323026.1 hypothetical protein PF001_g4126 [Phytophthora fragariae]